MAQSAHYITLSASVSLAHYDLVVWVCLCDYVSCTNTNTHTHIHTEPETLAPPWSPHSLGYQEDTPPTHTNTGAYSTLSFP